MKTKLIFDPKKFLKAVAKISKAKVSEYSKVKDAENMARFYAIGVLYKLADFSSVVDIYDDREAIQLHFGVPVGFARVQIFIKKDGKADVGVFHADTEIKSYDNIPVEAVGALVMPELKKLYKKELEE